MNIKKITSKISLLKKIKSYKHNILLNGIISVLSIFIIIMSISFILKLQKLNDFDKHLSLDKSRKDKIQVEVLNGCGISGAAEKITGILRKKNYDVVQMGNYSSFDIDESLVIDRTGNFKVAKDLADSLGITRDNVIQIINKNYLLDVSVVVGKDYKKLVQIN